jgi:hypothetical protein
MITTGMVPAFSLSPLLVDDALTHAFLQSLRFLRGTNRKLLKVPAQFLF